MARTVAVERRSLAVQVADALREMIMSNEYPAGTSAATGRDRPAAQRQPHPGTAGVPAARGRRADHAHSLQGSRGEPSIGGGDRGILRHPHDAGGRSTRPCHRQDDARDRGARASHRREDGLGAARTLGRAELEPACGALFGRESPDHARDGQAHPRQPGSVRAHPAFPRREEPPASAPGTHPAHRSVRGGRQGQGASPPVRAHQGRAR